MLLATAGRKSSPRARGSGIPRYPRSRCQQCPGKAWPHRLSAWGPQARRAAACPATGLHVLLPTQRAGKQPRCGVLTHFSAAARLPWALSVGTGCKNHNQSLGNKKVKRLSVLCRARSTVARAFLGSTDPWRQQETCSALGLFLVRQLENASEARNGALAGDTELDRSRSQDFAFQLSIGNRVFLLFQVFIKIHNY